MLQRVDEAIQFMKACGLSEDTAIMNETEFYVSHECLLMEYEQALTRQDSTTGLWCAMCWSCVHCRGAAWPHREVHIKLVSCGQSRACWLTGPAIP